MTWVAVAWILYRLLQLCVVLLFAVAAAYAVLGVRDRLHDRRYRRVCCKCGEVPLITGQPVALGYWRHATDLCCPLVEYVRRS